MKERPSRIPEAIKRAQPLILENLGCSVQRMEAIVSLSGITIRRIVKEDALCGYQNEAKK